MHKLIVVGSGIKSLAHLTEETKKVIQQADKVLYLVNEDTLKAWIEREAHSSESLEPIYFSYSERKNAYSSITDKIIFEYRRVKTLCVVFYGHPTVFAYSALAAVKKVKNENGDALILPAISSMDCLFSDLEIDPGNQGCFFIDATELIIQERKIDIQSHAIIFQAYNLGRYDTKGTEKLDLLLNYLKNYYLVEQPICIYQAALLPLQKSVINWILLEQIITTLIGPASTIYIPPAIQNSIDKKI